MADVSLLEAPPRAVEVQKFAKARNAELLSLHAALKKAKKKRRFSQLSQQEADCTSVIASTVLPRHLRRRTCSYLRRHRSLSWIYKKNKRVQQPRKKPKTDNSCARGAKSDKKADGISNQVYQNGTSGNDVEPVKKSKKVCRALRRLLEFKHGAPLLSGDGTRRLPTHVWHAKRFSMEKKWGFYIPVGRPGRGHGSRAVLRWSKEASLLQDASFCNAIQLCGTEGKLLQIISLMVEPTQDVNSVCGMSQPMCSAGYFTNALLYHAGKAPYNLIAPVLVVWKSEAEMSTANLTSGVDNTKYHSVRDLWLWVHAAAFKEALQALQVLCNRLNKDANDGILKCFSRQGDLGRLDLVGKKSFDVLQKIIFPVYKDKCNNSIKFYELSEVVRPTNLKNIMSMEVLDPRLNENERSFLCASCSVPSSADCQLDNNNIEHKDSVLEQDLCVLTTDILWEYRCSSKICSPAREKFYSKMRHVDRLASFGLTKTNATNGYRKTLSERMTCPIMLLTNNSQVPSSCWWSIILPLSWVPAFWVPLVFAGGHVIGEQERHWLCNDAGYASFPDDFPDCSAYSELMTIHNAMESVRSTSRRQPASTIDSRILFSDEVCASDLQYLSGEGAFVARTAAQLRSYLKACEGQRLLLFPAATHVADKTKTLGMRLHEGTMAWSPRSSHIISCSRTGWVRVLVHPFRRGVIEIGAILCSPTSEDYAKHCFLEEMEENPNNTSREMLGFVTSTCPRGSKTGASIGICIAVALGHIRGRQWVETSWYKNSEIFMMFCNKRSSTFRPAFASIVLERGPDV